MNCRPSPASVGLEIPVDPAAKRAPLFLPLHDEPHGHALHAARAQPGLHLLPEDRRERVAVETIENPAALLGPHEVLVHAGGVRQRLFHRVFGNLVEDDPADRHLWLQHLGQVPADRLPLAIGVGGQQHFRRLLQRGLEVGHLLLLVARHHVIGREVALDVDAEAAPLLVLDVLRDVGRRLGKVADVAVARLHPVLAAQEAPQRLCFRGGFDDHQRFSHVLAFAK